MKVIRRNVFETNSSSTHSITMCSKEDFDAWKKGKMLLDECDGKFITKEAALAKLKEQDEDLDLDDRDAVEDAMRDNEFLTYDDYMDGELEQFERSYKTKGGETVVAFGRYGYQ